MLALTSGNNSMALSNIKTRILVFVILFELIAYSTIQLFNHFTYKNELIQLKHEVIAQTFSASITKINHLTQLMERNVSDLAIAGENLFLLRKKQAISMDVLKARVESILLANFSSFAEAIGGGLWYEPYVLDTSSQYFGPYAYKTMDKVLFSWELNSAEYDYHQQSWYTLASENGWGREQQAYKPLLWTPPYYDDAGTFSLMMTVDAIMYDDLGTEIGMATVDWSLEQLTSFLESVKVSDHSFPFLIHVQSGQFLSYPKQTELVMKSAQQVNWGKLIFANKQKNQLDVINNFAIDNVLYNIYFFQTSSGFIFGSLSPVTDMVKEINMITLVTSLAGGAIGVGFIIMMVLLMRVVFSPFDKVLALIKNSITSKGEDGGVVIKPIDYSAINEFTPIIQALDDVYQQITVYMSEIVESNEQLSCSKKEIYLLNEELEDKVHLRTEQLAEKTAEALKSLQQLKNTQQQLIEQEKHAAMGRLVAGVAHEINTPLGIAITAASSMEEGIQQVYQDFEKGTLSKSDFILSFKLMIETAALLLLNLRRAANLVTNFKEVAVDQDSHEFCRFNLDTYISKIISSLLPKINHTNHQITLNCSNKTLEIYSIPGALVQIITNMVDNALDHAFTDEEPGIITIMVEEGEDDVIIRVMDNGSGMEKATAELIFDAFFTTSRTTGSCGLGLHIVYNLVTQQLKGRLECQSELSKGTSFIITLPKLPVK